jgi:Fur family zinc uptake transcriptional regulator
MRVPVMAVIMRMVVVIMVVVMCVIVVIMVVIVIVRMVMIIVVIVIMRMIVMIMVVAVVMRVIVVTMPMPMPMIMRVEQRTLAIGQKLDALERRELELVGGPAQRRERPLEERLHVRADPDDQVGLAQGLGLARAEAVGVGRAARLEEDAGRADTIHHRGRDAAERADRGDHAGGVVRRGTADDKAQETGGPEKGCTAHSILRNRCLVERGRAGAALLPAALTCYNVSDRPGLGNPRLARDSRPLPEKGASLVNSAVEQRLEQATELCRNRGQSLTPLRRRVFEIVLGADRPLGAYDVLEILARDADRGRVAPPTVYRSLDFLLEQGLVHKVLSVNGFVACSQATRPHAAELFICRQCGNTVEVARKITDRRLEAAADALDFKIESVVLEVRGLCSDCCSDAAA